MTVKKKKDNENQNKEAKERDLREMQWWSAAETRATTKKRMMREIRSDFM